MDEEGVVDEQILGVAAPRIASRALSVDSALLRLAPGPIVRTQIRAGLGVMPSFSPEEISMEEMNDLIAYIQASRRSAYPILLGE